MKAKTMRLPKDEAAIAAFCERFAQITDDYKRASRKPHATQAREIGFEPSVLSKYRTDTLPSVRNLIAICRYYGASADWLLGLTDERKGAQLKLVLDECSGDYVRLPQDADGVTWRIGDRKEDGAELFELILEKDRWLWKGWDCVVYDPAKLRHGSKPALDDVLAKHGLDRERFGKLLDALKEVDHGGR